MTWKNSSLTLQDLPAYATHGREASTRHTRVKRLDVAARPRTRNWEQLAFQSMLVLTDALAVGLSLFLAYTLRLSSGVLTYHADYAAEKYSLLVGISIPIWLMLFYAMGLYDLDNLLGGVVEYQQMSKACVGGVIAVILISFFWRDFALVSRGWILLSLGLSIFILNGDRFFMRRVGYWLRRRGWLMSRTLIVGANEQGLAMARQWMEHPESGVKVVGFLDDFKPLHMPICDGVEVLGRPSQIEAIANQHRVQDVILVSNAVAWETFEVMIRETDARAPYTLRLSPGFYEILSTHVAVHNKTFVPLFTVYGERLVGIEAAIKLIEDLSLGLLLSLLTLPMSLPIALGLKLQRPHAPVFTRSVTLGQGGGFFRMFKFRSARDLEKWGMEPTGLEEFLYRSGLDKLPQLINVLRCQMSLVGPRPQVLGHAHPDHRFLRQLQTIKPGMTGPWLVSAFWTSADEKRNELYYIRNWTLWLDFQILFQTARLIFFAPTHSRQASKEQ